MNAIGWAAIALSAAAIGALSQCWMYHRGFRNGYVSALEWMRDQRLKQLEQLQQEARHD